MNIYEAIKEAASMGDDVWVSESVHAKKGSEAVSFYSIDVDGVCATCCDSWEEGLDEIRKKDPEAIKQRRVAELKAELAKLEGEAA